MLSRRTFVVGAAAGLLTAPAARAQQQRRVPRISYLSPNPPGDWRVQELLKGMADLGQFEGRSFSIEYFHAPSTKELPAWAAKAVASRPDIIVAISTPGALAAKALTTTIPIVFAGPSAPVETGLVASLARPGGNITGPSQMGPDVAGKRLQLLQQIVPLLARVAVVHDANDPAGVASLKEVLFAGRVLKIELDVYNVTFGGEFEPIVAMAKASGAQALQFVTSAYYTNQVRRIAALALQHGLPAIFDYREFPDAGGLMAYGANARATHRRAAYYVDRILRGTRPQDLPVEQPMLFDFVINKKTADALGLEIPLGLWVQATEILE